MIKLVIADKNYSSWSMRPWVLMRHFGIEFEEILVRLALDDTDAQIRRYSPSGRVPALVETDGAVVWDSLAIAETLAERYTQHALWPRDAAARAHARSVSAEMHSGFGALRNEMPMKIRARLPGQGATPEALADVARIDALWSECLAQYGGPFLFGEFGIADAMFAPVVMRFNTYSPALSPAASAYAQRLDALPAVRQWCADALADERLIARYEVPVTVLAAAP
jgi:glutathione S-transferase